MVTANLLNAARDLGRQMAKGSWPLNSQTAAFAANCLDEHGVDGSDENIDAMLKIADMLSAEIVNVTTQAQEAKAVAVVEALDRVHSRMIAVGLIEGTA